MNNSLLLTVLLLCLGIALAAVALWLHAIQSNRALRRQLDEQEQQRRALLAQPSALQSPMASEAVVQGSPSEPLTYQEMQRRGDLLRGALDVLNEAFVLYDPQDRLVFCNERYRSLYARSADLMVEGATFESIIRVGAERGQYMEAMGRVDEWVAERMAVHRSGTMALEQRLSDGRWLRVLERRMPDGHLVGFRVDITELKLATAAAEAISAQRGEEQRRLQSILEGTHVGTWEWNVQTGHSIYNEQYVAMVGYTLQELEPLSYDTWARMVHPDDLVVSAQRMQEHLSGARASYEVEVRVRHKAGHWVWVLAKGKLATRTRDGRPLWVYGTHMDITERKEAEQKLAQTMAMLQNVLDSATAVGVLTLTPSQHISMFNKGAENLLGYAASEVMERALLADFFEVAELAALRETLELMWGYEPSQSQLLNHVMGIRQEQEWTLVRKDGSRFKANLIFSPLLDAQGMEVGHLGMVYDISKQKEYESSLREAMHLAEQSSVAKSQFLANMSHEIRTPMNAILGMLQLLRNTSLEPNQRDYAEKASGAARSLLGLLNDILDFSKVEAGKMQLNPEPFGLEELLDDVSVILSSNLGGKDVDLVFEVDAAIPSALVGDAMRIKQILINLGGNAVKFTEHGQVCIRWRLLAHTPQWAKLSVEVEDTGIGIAAENQARIFEGFTQAEANTTRRFGGTGLGLVISTRLIRLMGGELRLQSALGQGSCFSFTIDLPLPLTGFNPSAGTSADAPNAVAPRAMVVDDNPVALAAAVAMLQSRAWDVVPMPSGPAALDYLAQAQPTANAFQAIFVDADLPGMDGSDMPRALRRACPVGQPAALVLLSRHSRDALAAHYKPDQPRMDALVVRPFTASALLRAVDAVNRPQQIGGPTSLTARPLQGMRVLLVEDNPINQQVAQELLRGEGAQVTLADNGALGVAALQQQPDGFDVVLMDLQMPVMDGLTATRSLRAEPRFAQLPIVAMTANAMASDREECLQAGMNDHIGKPFDIQQLVHTVVRLTAWTVHGHLDALDDRGVAEQAPRPVPLGQMTDVWPVSVDVPGALARMGGNRPLLLRSLKAFMSDAVDLPQRLAQLERVADWPQMRRELHALKGLSATVGVQALAQAAAQAESQMTVSGPVAGYAQALSALESAIENCMPDLQQVVGGLQPTDADATASPPASGTQTGVTWPDEQLQALLRALQIADMQALDLYAQLQPFFSSHPGDAVEALDAAMSNLDFEAAAQQCAKLVQQSGEISIGAHA